MVLSADFCFSHASPTFQVEFVIICCREIKVDADGHCWVELLMKDCMVKSWHAYGADKLGKTLGGLSQTCQRLCGIGVVQEGASHSVR